MYPKTICIETHEYRLAVCIKIKTRGTHEKDSADCKRGSADVISERDMQLVV